MITTAMAMVKCLEKEGTNIIFGIPGAAICPFYDALSKSNIRHILVRHEQSAGHAASGYARITNKPAVCVATSGPGALNLITSIATAYMDSVPLIVITGQVSSDLLGRDVFQEADITGSAEPFVKHSYLVKKATDIPRIFKEAFLIASTGRQGPVLIDIPVNIQNEQIEFAYPDKIDIRSYKPNTQGHAGQIKRVVTAIKTSKKPLICAGGGVLSANAQDELLSLSKKTGIPIVTTMMGISSVSPTYKLHIGMIGMHGHSNANLAMNEADLLILVGARVGDRAIMSPIGLSETTTIVHIDIDPAEIGKNMNTHIPVVGDAKSILSDITDKVTETDFSNWTSHIISFSNSDKSLYKSLDNYINPHQLVDCLMNKTNDSTCIVADVGQNQIWTARGYKVKNGRFLTSGGMGTMGYSIPAAMGTYLADSSKQVIAVCGDGGFQMSMMELSTIVANSIAIKIIIMNNNSLGMVKELQNNQYQGNQTAVSLNFNPDFIKLTQAYGIKSKRISSLDGIDDILDEFLNDNSPCLLECVINPNEPTLPNNLK